MCWGLSKLWPISWGTYLTSVILAPCDASEFSWRLSDYSLAGVIELIWFWEPLLRISTSLVFRSKLFEEWEQIVLVTFPWMITIGWWPSWLTIRRSNNLLWIFDPCGPCELQVWMCICGVCFLSSKANFVEDICLLLGEYWFLGEQEQTMYVVSILMTTLRLWLEQTMDTTHNSATSRLCDALKYLSRTYLVGWRRNVNDWTFLDDQNQILMVVSLLTTTTNRGIGVWVVIPSSNLAWRNFMASGASELRFRKFLNGSCHFLCSWNFWDG